MKVQVCYFAVLREHRGIAVEQLEIEEGTTMAELFGRLFGGTALADLPVLYALNQAYVQGQTPIPVDSEVCFLPPLGGG